MIVDKLARWSVEREKTYVKHPERARRMLVLDALIFLATFVCWALWPLAIGTWVGITLSIIVGLQLGRTGLLGIRRASTYRSGWLDGRSQMMSSLSEALRRGMTPDEWATRELSRDMATLGVSVDPDEVLRQMRDEGEAS